MIINEFLIYILVKSLVHKLDVNVEGRERLFHLATARREEDRDREQLR